MHYFSLCKWNVILIVISWLWIWMFRNFSRLKIFLVLSPDCVLYCYQYSWHLYQEDVPFNFDWITLLKTLVLVWKQVDTRNHGDVSSSLLKTRAWLLSFFPSSRQVWESDLEKEKKMKRKWGKENGQEKGMRKRKKKKKETKENEEKRGD